MRVHADTGLIIAIDKALPYFGRYGQKTTSHTDE